MEHKSKPIVTPLPEGDLPKYDKILLIICDQFRFPRHWEKLVENGSFSKEAFPNLARLQRTGREFRNAYIASSACNASRACIYTGKYSQETGVTSTSGFGNESTWPRTEEEGNEVSWLGLHPSDPECSLPSDDVIKTLGTHFREAGYRAIYKGKWHLSEVEGGWPDKPYDAEGLAKFGFEGWNPPEGHGSSPLRWGMGADTSYVQDAVNTLYELKDTNYKWFMAVNLINPHDIGFFGDWPMKVPDFHLNRPRNYEDGDTLINSKPLAQSIGKWYWNYSTFYTMDPTESVWADYANYYAHLAQIADFNIGILLDTLESTEQRKDTMVIFLSDHGEMGGSHGLTQKWYQAYEETIHVPLIFSNPQLPHKGKPTYSMASLIDIAPTLLSLAGIHQPTGKDVLRGVNLRAAIHDPEISVQKDILYVTDDDIVGSIFGDVDASIPPRSNWKGERAAEKKYRESFIEQLPVSISDIKNAPRHVRAIKTDDNWKLVRYTVEATQEEEANATVYEMYNLNNDPGELINLAAPANIDERNLENSVRFNDLRTRLDTLLMEKYYHESLRQCEGEE